VLSRIVADLVGYGDLYRDYLRKRLFDPLGMHSPVAGFDEVGVFVASSFLHARALDFAKFGLLYLRGGEWDGRQLISRQWRRRPRRRTVATRRTAHCIPGNGG